MIEKKFWGILALGALLLLAGCTADEDAEQSRTLVPIELTAAVLDEGGAVGSTRAGATVQSTHFVSGEPIYVTFTNSPAQVTHASAVYRSAGASGRMLIGDNERPCFTPTGTTTSVQGYHGRSGGVEGDQVTNSTTSFTVATDQSTDAAYQASDLMYASAISLTKSGDVTTGVLSFTHKMSKITLEITAGDGVSAITGVYIIGGDKTVALSGGNCTLGATSDALSDASPITVWTGSASAVDCAALIPPQTIAAGTAFLKVVTNAVTVTYTLPEAQTFPEGNYYSYAILVSH